MEFFNSAVDVLKTLVVALGAGLGVWGAAFLRIVSILLKVYVFPLYVYVSSFVVAKPSFTKSQ